jgi:hypothetical protein
MILLYVQMYSHYEFIFTISYCAFHDVMNSWHDSTVWFHTIMKSDIINTHMNLCQLYDTFLCADVFTL